MNARERFLATAEFRPVDRTFLLAPWAWDSTVARWQNEGSTGLGVERISTMFYDEPDLIHEMCHWKITDTIPTCCAT